MGTFKDLGFFSGSMDFCVLGAQDKHESVVHSSSLRLGGSSK